MRRAGNGACRIAPPRAPPTLVRGSARVPMRNGRHRRLRLLASALFGAGIATAAAAQKEVPRPQPSPKVVGTSAPIEVAPDLGQSFQNNGAFLWGDLISVPGASFLKAHLVDVNLRAG